MTRDISKLTTLKLKRPKLVVLEGQTQRVAEDDEDAAKEDMVDSSAKVELPATLQEYGVPIPEHNTQYKPLYLIKLLESDPDPSIGKAVQRPPASPRSSEASDSATSTDSEDSSPPSKPTTLSPRQSPTHSTPPTHGTLIFTSSNESAHRLSRLLQLLRPSWSLAPLTKSTSSSSNRKTLTQFLTRNLSVLIASDRASRGLDIPDLAQVINYDMPSSVTSYVHRVGRTARAGKAGKAVTLVLHNQGKWFWKDESGVTRGKMLGREVGRKVVRLNLGVEVGGKVGKEYEDALKRLGEEATSKGS